MLQFMLAFELLRFRMPPAAVALLVTGGWGDAAAGFAAAARRLLGRDAAPRRLLIVDALALHEPGKTVIADDLLSSLESVGEAELRDGTPARSLLSIDPEALLAAVVGMLPRLRRPVARDDLLHAVAALA